MCVIMNYMQQEIFNKSDEEMDQGISFDDFVRAMEHHRLVPKPSSDDQRYRCSLALEPAKLAM